MAHPVHVTTADPFRHAPASAEHALFTAVAAGDANAVVAVLSKLESSLSLSSVANCLGRRGQFVREAHDGRLVKHGTAASPFFSSSSPPQREHEPPHNINDGGGGDGGDVDDDGGAELVSPLGLALLLAAQSPDPSASLSADDSVCSVLVRHGARLSGGFGAGGATEALTPLHRAVLSGEEALVWWVLGTAGAFSPLSRRASGLNCVGATAGASASAGNNPCTPNSNNAATNTAINTETAATSSCSATAASSLGFDINAPTRDDEGLTALHLAAMGAGVACEEACADEEECAALGLSPLPTAVGSGGGSPAVDPTDAADSALNTRQSPSPQCIYRRRLAIVRLLLMGGADPNAVDAAGQTPLFAAAQYGDEGTLEALIHWEGSAAADAADDDAKSAVASQHRFANTNPLTRTVTLALATRRLLTLRIALHRRRSLRALMFLQRKKRPLRQMKMAHPPRQKEATAPTSPRREKSLSAPLGGRSSFPLMTRQAGHRFTSRRRAISRLSCGRCCTYSPPNTRRC